MQPGTYTLEETPPAGAFATVANVGSINGSPVGTATNTSTISTIALGSGGAGPDITSGSRNSASVSGTEYIDNDANNVFDSGDSPVAGVTISLTDASKTS